MESVSMEQITALRNELVCLVEQGLSLQDRCVLEKSQALDLLLVAYQQQTACDTNVQG